ncbi:hypothetical protein [Croceicoccus marinus]|uniref:Uncharacterized protein n=1 Tax=Croceicoccus marinus TaxID=450378 RepID=A0A1Z1FD85_9SPHN|nr:hypothetical protein [Croceicoccus marinus]ARU16715.1 hypothetical protein A9D14_11650 [Croceicoccus marinus]
MYDGSFKVRAMQEGLNVDDEEGITGLPDLPEMRSDAATPPFEAFAHVSKRMLDGYSLLVSSGFRPDAIGMAMLGATVNFYDMLGMREVLPNILRSMADSIDSDDSLH